MAWSQSPSRGQSCSSTQDAMASSQIGVAGGHLHPGSHVPSLQLAGVGVWHVGVQAMQDTNRICPGQIGCFLRNPVPSHCKSVLVDLHKKPLFAKSRHCRGVYLAAMHLPQSYEQVSGQYGSPSIVGGRVGESLHATFDVTGTTIMLGSACAGSVDGNDGCT